MKHHKHPPLARPALGRYGRNEWAIVGTACGKIQQLAHSVTAALHHCWHCAYLDADHASADTNPAPAGMLAAGARLEYTDQIHSHRLCFGGNWGSHQFRALLNDADLILVNGNHHEAAAQVVVIDPAKETSLRKRLAQLTDVQLILLAGDADQVFDFVENALPNSAAVPRLRLGDTLGVVRFFEEKMRQRTPPLHGLVLAGGRSLRMGRDKGSIVWHQKPQREHAADLLRPFCAEVHLSCRPDQVAEFLPSESADLAEKEPPPQFPIPNSQFPILPDTFSELGPYGAILSAFRQNPNCAWLVVACDMPLLDAGTLRFLVENRRPRHLATTFRSPHDQMPEPLLTIWEPKSYAVLLSFLAQGYSCPRKVLLNSDTLVLAAPDSAALTNVNTPEEANEVMKVGT